MTDQPAQPTGATYEAAGVDIDAGDKAVELMKVWIDKAKRPEMVGGIGGFAGLTLLTKNAFLDEIHKQYVVTARANGADERRVLYGHVFRNAMLLIIAGFPAAFIGILFTGFSLLLLCP